MGRLRNFDTDDALDAAMHAFWAGGFEAVSFDQLVEQTGASRHSLYQMFGSKRDLLLRALDRYERTVLSALVVRLKGDDSSLDALDDFFLRMSKVARQSQPGGPGCLMCNSLIEMGSDHEVRARVDTFFRRLRKNFLACLERAQETGELGPDSDTAQLSRYLIGLVRGVSANARSQSIATEYRAYVEVSLSILRT